MMINNLKTVFESLCILFFFSSFFLSNDLFPQTNDDCFVCHEDKNSLASSVHKNLACISCHADASVPEFPHPEYLQPVNCNNCHQNEQTQFFAGVHGQAERLNNQNAPGCLGCHGNGHTILSRTSPKSPTYKLNIPYLCGKCHKEGEPIERVYKVTEDNIIKNYSENIHEKGLFERGFIATATCNDCHGSHLILPHSSPHSSTSSEKIASTCMKCHGRIKEVHGKIFKNDIYTKNPDFVPVCTDCHQPHIAKINSIIETGSNKLCLSCHEGEGSNNIDAKFKVEISDLINSSHKNIQCIKCHIPETSEKKSDLNKGKTGRPCETVQKVDCSNCHSGVSILYKNSGHGQALLNKNTNAPYCTDCHGTHKIKTRYDDTSPTYRGAVPELCGKCHEKSGKAVEKTHLREIDAFNDYSSSVHGKGLNQKGLLMSAVCTDCHTSHNILKESDPNSTINPDNVPTTCSKCHFGIYRDYMSSDHAKSEENSGKKIATCTDCHSAHTITRIDNDKFLTEVTLQCGSCHKQVSETYLETYHGKAYSLGYLKTARCSDCHGSHKILKVSNPDSEVGSNNIVSTCKKCHPSANKKFTGFLTHATHKDNRILNIAFWGMTSLLLGVFGFFGLHTLLWLPRSIVEAFKRKRHAKPIGKARYFRRFSRSQRITHLFVIVSFILLALTGMILKFANSEWANNIAKLIGGVHFAGVLHRFGAIITFGYFVFHIFSLIKIKIREGKKWMDFIFGTNALMFNKQDVLDFLATIKWFLWLGPRPQYGRWTYWEKFDYFAVFWGVAIIGFSGLILWFPVFFTKFFPGLIINLALIIHSDEALLAVGFIFTIHFFNTHLRPESFPMDTVIFTGHVPLDEYKADRPREYEELEKLGKLGNVVVNKEISPRWLTFVKVCGFVFLFLGISLIFLIIFSLIK